MLPLRPIRLSAALALVLVVAASCAEEPPSPPAPTAPAGFVQHYLTRDHTDVTAASATAAGVRVTAPTTNVDINSRAVLHPVGTAASADHGACTTATHSGLPVQEGVALRIRNEAGRTRAITVTKNIWANADEFYNVHTWDTARSPELSHLARHDMAGAVRAGATRRLCARVDGDVVSFKMWSEGSAEPTWSDPTHARSTRLPSGWSAAGRPGWYIGHVPPGGWANLTSMTILGAATPTPPAPTTTSTTTPSTTSTTTPGSDAGDVTEPAPGDGPLEDT